MGGLFDGDSRPAEKAKAADPIKPAEQLERRFDASQIGGLQASQQVSRGPVNLASNILSTGQGGATSGKAPAIGSSGYGTKKLLGD